MNARLRVGICLLFCPPALLAQQLSSSDLATARAAMNTLRADAIRAHMRFLSDSLLEGRAPDSPGYQIAARYVATELESMGLRPGGLKGHMVSTVPLRKAVLDTSKSSLALIATGPGPMAKCKSSSTVRTMS